MCVIIAHLQILHLWMCLFLIVCETRGAGRLVGWMSPEIRKLEISYIEAIILWC